MIRILQDPALDGPTNMARDETLMRRVGARESPPTIRLYQWDPPTISLGYFQAFAAYEALPPPAGTLPVVRRLTGGGAILHDLELTYSLALPAEHGLLSEGPNRLYELAHDAIMACLRALGLEASREGDTDDSGPRRGPFFCFARRHCLDVLVNGHKVAGSAQRRTKQAVLQHGSIILGNRYAQQPLATFPVSPRPARATTRSHGVRGTLTFDESVGRLRLGIPPQLTSITGAPFEVGQWSERELSLADTLVAKYAGNEWTKRE